MQNAIQTNITKDNTDYVWEPRQSPEDKVGNLLFEAQLILVVSYYYMKRVRKFGSGRYLPLMSDYTHHHSVGKRRTTCLLCRFISCKDQLPFTPLTNLSDGEVVNKTCQLQLIYVII